MREILLSEKARLEAKAANEALPAEARERAKVHLQDVTSRLSALEGSKPLPRGKAKTDLGAPIPCRLSKKVTTR